LCCLNLRVTIIPMFMLEIFFIAIIGIVQSKVTNVFFDDFENGAHRWHTSNRTVPQLAYVTGTQGEDSFSLLLNSCSIEFVFSLPSFECSYTNKCVISFDSLGVPFQSFSTLNNKILFTLSKGIFSSIHYNLIPNSRNWVHIEYLYPETIASEVGKRIVFGSRESPDNNCLISYVDNVQVSKVEDKSESETTQFPFVILFTSLAVLMLSGVICMIKKLGKCAPAEDISLRDYEALFKAREWSNEVIPLEFSQMEKDEILGEGNSATVWKYKWHGIKVAVKSLKIDEEGSYHYGSYPYEETKDEREVHEKKQVELRRKGIHNLEREIFIILAVGTHDNVIPLFGYVANPSSVVMKYMPGKSVYDHMVVNYICPEDKIKIAKKVSAALVHLHAARVIHRDIASRNVLLGQPIYDGTHYRIAQVVLSDFGLSLGLKPGESVSIAPTNYGPVAWMSPESLKGSYSPATDCYMFSTFLWELFQEDTPFKDHQKAHCEEDGLFSLATLAQKVTKGVTPRIDPSWSNFHDFVDIVETGWSFLPSDRDTMVEVHRKLARLQAHDVPPTPTQRMITVSAGYTAVADL